MYAQTILTVVFRLWRTYYIRHVEIYGDLYDYYAAVRDPRGFRAPLSSRGLVAIIESNLLTDDKTWASMFSHCVITIDSNLQMNTLRNVRKFQRRRRKRPEFKWAVRA